MSRRILLPLLLLLPALLAAQASGGSYVLRKQAIASGGTRAQGGSYTLVSTSGQAHAAVALGGAYRLTGGFHRPTSAQAPENLFANGFE